jgi:general secretion pathway protein G
LALRSFIARGQKVHAAMRRGLTLVELMLVLGIVAALLTLALPKYADYRLRIKIDQAQRDIAMISTLVDLYWQDAKDYPPDLGAVGQGDTLDPWGAPYQYLNMNTKGSKGKARKDHSLVPINSDYDLYSMGPDGKSVSPLTAKASRDDIIRANNGKYIGPASQY